MYSEELEEVIAGAIADGALSEKERAILHKRAQAEGVDPDELDIVIEGRLAKMRKDDGQVQESVRPLQNGTSNKMGNVVKCPNCGSQVIGGMAVCSECGYAFFNVEANRSIEKLQKKLEEATRGISDDTKSTTVRMDIITTFPVPNTRADLLDFLAMIQPMAKSTGPKNGQTLSNNENLSYGYWILFTNCINKARISFANDKDFLTYFALHEKERNKAKGIIGFIKCNPRLTIALSIVLFYIVFFAWIIISES